MSNRYYIPDNLTNWKWPRRINPHYPEVKAVSAAWARSFKAFSPKAQYAYDRCDFNLLASLAYPLLDKDRLRAGCDLMHFYTYDEYSDVSPEDEVQVMAEVMMDALSQPTQTSPQRRIWELTIKTASPQSQKHFIYTCAAYTQSVAQQAADRTHKHVRTIQEYLEVRRDTIGAKAFFPILETTMNLPDEAVYHPDNVELSIRLLNDDNHNIITIVMHHNRTDVQGAMDWVYNYHKELEAKFMNIYENKIPKFGEPVDSELAVYVDASGLGNMVRAVDQWNFESEIFFGKKAPEIQKTRSVNLLPKERPNEIGPQLVDGSLL